MLRANDLHKPLTQILISKRLSDLCVWDLAGPSKRLVAICSEEAMVQRLVGALMTQQSGETGSHTPSPYRAFTLSELPGLPQERCRK